MSLRSKFGVLLGMLGIAVLIAMAAAWWSLDVMHNEARLPVRSMSEALLNLSRIKRAVEDAGSALHGSSSSQSTGVRDASPPSQTSLHPASLSDARAAITRAISSLADVEAEDTSLTRIGKGTLSNLRLRLDTTRIALQSPDARAPASRELVIRSLFEVHELIERAESRIIEDTRSSLQHSADVRQQLGYVLALVVVLVLLFVLLGLSLVRRWVMLPVANLRSTVSRFGTGDLEIRPLPVSPSRTRDEIAQLAREFNHMAITIKSLQNERVDRERLAAVGEMVRRLAHNLRNPLAGIRSLAELSRAELRSSTPDTADLHNLQNRIITTVDRFEQWLTDLLRVTRPAQIDPQLTPILPWLSNVVETHRPAAEARGVHLALDTASSPHAAVFDPRHLEHALSALISNAIEAASQSSTPPYRVAIRAADYKENPDIWIISVADSGRGVDPKHRDRLFTPYFTTKSDGNGIGLASSAQVVRAHSGQISLISPSDGHEQLPGACFLIRLPRSGPPVRPEGAGAVASIGQNGAAGGQDPGH